MMGVKTCDDVLNLCWRVGVSGRMEEHREREKDERREMEKASAC